jgi:hypothetical protein
VSAGAKPIRLTDEERLDCPLLISYRPPNLTSKINQFCFDAAIFMSRRVAVCSRLFPGIFRRFRNLSATPRDMHATYGVIFSARHFGLSMADQCLDLTDG